MVEGGGGWCRGWVEQAIQSLGNRINYSDVSHRNTSHLDRGVWEVEKGVGGGGWEWTGWGGNGQGGEEWEWTGWGGVGMDRVGVEGYEL